MYLCLFIWFVHVCVFVLQVTPGAAYACVFMFLFLCLYVFVCILFCICICFGFAGASTSWQFARLQELLWWLSASASAAGVMNISARRAHPTLQCRDEYIILHCKKYTIAHPFGASLHSLK